jgi:hypothetical protein
VLRLRLRLADEDAAERSREAAVEDDSCELLRALFPPSSSDAVVVVVRVVAVLALRDCVEFVVAVVRVRPADVAVVRDLVDGDGAGDEVSPFSDPDPELLLARRRAVEPVPRLLPETTDWSTREEWYEDVAADCFPDRDDAAVDRDAVVRVVPVRSVACVPLPLPVVVVSSSLATVRVPRDASGDVAGVEARRFELIAN